MGNSAVVHRLRSSIAGARLPQTIILAGPRGAGKYTLALMVAQAANCLRQPVAEDGLPDFCGACENCTRIAAAAPREARLQEAVAAREEMRDSDKKDTRILIQTHPDVLVIPPDPPQFLIKIGQVRRVLSTMYRLPAEARRAFYIFTDGAFMKEAANSLLKVLEEPPAHASLFLLTTRLQELLPTIRSRAAIYTLGALSLEDLEQLLMERRAELAPAQRTLVARLAQGAAGRALSFNLEEYLQSRQQALVMLRGALGDFDAGALFRVTETYRASAEGQQKTVLLLRTLSGLLEDLLVLLSGNAGLVRNIDLEPELSRMADDVSFAWIEGAARSLSQVEAGMRRNLLRSLSLDAFATSLAFEQTTAHPPAESL